MLLAGQHLSSQQVEPPRLTWLSLCNIETGHWGRHQYKAGDQEENPTNLIHFESKTMFTSNSPARWFGSRTTYRVDPTFTSASVRETGGVPGAVTAV
jgi:hypothetical protein